MPPKLKITEEMIIEEAIALIRESGWNALNARSLAKRLDCSTQPLFRAFKNMEELKQEVYVRVMQDYNEHMVQGMQEKDGFLNMGLNYIHYAMNEPNLFQFLFMSGAFKVDTIRDIVEGEEEQPVVDLITTATGFSTELAKDLYTEIWLFTHGIASLISTNGCKVTEEEIRRILGDAYYGLLKQLKERGESQ